ncbi:YggT family protein [Amycolatopsis sp. NPDC059657]|uniref:YggT family protein n=1 Tax=Amycolatopsis sp. NPDC059657 TaxID=3346899 RepID=UPI003671B1E2
MSALGYLLGVLLTLFEIVLIARLILDWSVSLAGRLPSWTYRARGLTHTVTEPVIRPVRRLLPPVRAGAMSLDLAFTVVFVIVVILQGVAFSL